MSIRVALHHKTVYHYDRRVQLGAQVIRLRPAVHSRTPVESYSLNVEPEGHYLNWQQDPFGNYLARCVFSEPVEYLSIEVDLITNLSAVNPFDFFLEPDAEYYPFGYPVEVLDDLKPYFAQASVGPKFYGLLQRIDRTPRKTIDFLVELNQQLEKEIDYLVRLEPGVQTPEQTLELGSGSCRDTAWLMAQVLRHLGFASRFVSGYLIQLVADQKPLDGPAGPPADFTDLHAWTEVYLPGAGWVGLDPTSGLLTGEGHIPLACTPQPSSAAPITGALGECEVTFDFEMSVKRIHEDPRVTKPYTDEQWRTIEALGHDVDRKLNENDVRLTMGGEPTFVSIDDMDGDEWQTAAVGPNKERLASDLMQRLRDRFGPSGLMHFGQGKWYPGESLPRWAMHCYWRQDGEAIWKNHELFAKANVDYGHTIEHAERFAMALAERLEVDPDHAVPVFEDAMYYTWRERRLPANVDVHNSKLEEIEERERLSKVFEQGITTPAGMILPLQFRWWDAAPCWQSGDWVVRSDELFLIPGDSSIGYRLPLEALLCEADPGYPVNYFEADPMAPLAKLPSYQQLRDRPNRDASVTQGGRWQVRADHRVRQVHQFATVGGRSDAPGDGNGNWHPGSDPTLQGNGRLFAVDTQYDDPSSVVRTALCVEPRENKLHVFLPPTDRLEVFLDLVAAIEETATTLDMPVVLEGYLPPHDARLQHIKVTPDPGVIEVNVQPASNWNELVAITTGVYEDARQSRLGTEKFDLDGAHTGTGGGNHVVLGGPTPADSPWLRRPDLLKSFVGYWHNHPSLSYLFSGKFIGPTSQAPRVDETRSDSVYELNIAFEQVTAGRNVPPWLVDRVFRHILVDGTGNTHRSEFCIDKLFSPDTTSGRLGLVEFRAFEMPPHAEMSLTQQLLLRALVARFWENSYADELVNWNTTIHDRWMLPHFIRQDFGDVIDETVNAGFPLQKEWFDAHYEFRYPRIGKFTQRGVNVELRKAMEPWYTLGEEPGGGYTARYVDSSVERLQVKVQGLTDPRVRIELQWPACSPPPNGYRGRVRSRSAVPRLAATELPASDDWY